MAEYQKVEYRIAQDGTIIETVLNGTGTSCTETTAPLEAALGETLERKLLPEFEASSETPIESIQQSTQSW